MAKSKEKIAEALGITPTPEIEVVEDKYEVVHAQGVEVIENKSLVEKKEESKELSVSTAEKLEKDSLKDYNSVRENLKGLIEQGKVAIDGVLSLAEQGESARTYEVVADLIRTVSTVNKDLMDLHKSIKDLRQEEINFNQTNNNSIYVGSTKELQELINPSRSTAKQNREE